MESEELTVRDPVSVDDATMLDQDMGMTEIAAEDATVLSAGQGADVDEPTIYERISNSPKLDETATQRDAPANTTSIKGPTVKRLFTGEEVAISSPIFCIGRNEDADYSVSHNPAISRKHAEIISRKGRYYIRDLGAKNRTYVNGKLLPAKSESELANGDVIKLANEDFLVRL